MAMFKGPMYGQAESYANKVKARVSDKMKRNAVTSEGSSATGNPPKPKTKKPGSFPPIKTGTGKEKDKKPKEDTEGGDKDVTEKTEKSEG